MIVYAIHLALNIEQWTLFTPQSEYHLTVNADKANLHLFTDCSSCVNLRMEHLYCTGTHACGQKMCINIIHTAQSKTMSCCKASFMCP